MLRKLIVCLSIFSIAIGSANAATILLPGASGIPDENHTSFNGCTVDVPSGKMLIQPYPNLPNNDCFMSYPINLPVGSTIDGVEIAYYDGSGASGRSISAYLGENRLKPFLGTIAVGGANDFTVPSFQMLYMNMGQLSVPVANGNTYWVQVSTHRITEVAYVAVTYH
jgi:hypothetical protein